VVGLTPLVESSCKRVPFKSVRRTLTATRHCFQAARYLFKAVTMDNHPSLELLRLYELLEESHQAQDESHEVREQYKKSVLLAKDNLESAKECLVEAKRLLTKARSS